MGRYWGLSGSEDATVFIWNLRNGRTLQTLEGHTSGVLCLAVNWEMYCILTGSDDQTLRLWQLDEKGLTVDSVIEFESHEDSVKCVAVDWGKQVAISGCL